MKTVSPCQLWSLTQPFTAVVIGASGGIGRAIVAELLAHSQVGRLIATSRRNAALRDIASEHHQDPRLRTCRVDTLDEASLAELALEVERAPFPLQLMLNATGMLSDAERGPERRLEEANGPWLSRVFEVNAVGPLLVLKHLTPHLPKDERVVLASLSARVGSIDDNRLGGWYGYRASKAALNQFVRCASIELKRRAPRTICVALHPGTVKTSLSDRFTKRLGPDKLFSPQRAARQLLHVSDGLTETDTGGFFAWDGTTIPW